MKINKKFSLIMLFCACTIGINAQTNGTNSPYSRYGFGQLSDHAQGFNKGMSGLALGMRNGKQINFQNPASYSAIDSLSFLLDIGMSIQNCNYSSNNTKINVHNAALDYISAAFRLKKNFGMYIGLHPYSSIGYNLSQTTNLSNILDSSNETTTTSNSGEGGLHEFGLGFGWKTFKNLSLGTNIYYLWGDYSHNTTTSFSNTNVNTISRTYTANINTYKVDFGLQYEHQLKNKDLLTIGLTYGLGHKINNDAIFYDQTIANSTLASADTMKIKKAFELPHTFGVGISWNHENRLRVGFDYIFEHWKDLNFPTLQENGNSSSYVLSPNSFSNKSKYIVGFDYTPNPMGLKYSEQITYRFGLSYSTPYTKINNMKGANTYCVSMGVALPIKTFFNKRSLLNISAQWEHVKPQISSMITENYLRRCVGISFNERWFMKWKVE